MCYLGYQTLQYQHEYLIKPHMQLCFSYNQYGWKKSRIIYKHGKCLEFLPLFKKWRLVKETKHFIIQDGIMYQMGQDRKFQRCVTRDQA